MFMGGTYGRRKATGKATYGTYGKGKAKSMYMGGTYGKGKATGSADGWQSA